MCPSSSTMMLPLCLSLIWSRKPSTEYAAIEVMKARRAFFKGAQA